MAEKSETKTDAKVVADTAAVEAAVTDAKAAAAAAATAATAAPAGTVDAPVEPVKTNLMAGGKPVVAVPEAPEVTPGPAQPTPEAAAKQPPADEPLIATVGIPRVETSVEKLIKDQVAGDEMNLLRDPREAHNEAARLSMIAATPGATMVINDLGALKGTVETGGIAQARVRLIFEWFDGQGVYHEAGKLLNLPTNEVEKLVGTGKAERVGVTVQVERDLALEKAIADGKALGLTV